LISACFCTATFGHLAYSEDASIEDLEIFGIGLVFASWPVVLGTLPGGEHWPKAFTHFLGIQ